MSDVSNAADIGGDAGVGDGAVAVMSLERDSKVSSIHDAARALQGLRKREETPAADAQPEGQRETPPTKSAEEADAAPQPEAPGATETKEPDTQAEPAAIEPPRSWTKEAKEQWQSLPRETQEYLATREQERDRELRRSQNDAAEKLKGLSAKEQAVEQARQHYEAALPVLQQTLQAQITGEFADIKTMADVEKMSVEDWPRYIKWDAAQKKLAVVAQEAANAQARQQHEAQQSLVKFANEQDKLLLEHAPELADQKRAAAESDAAIKYLKDIGLTDDELSGAWNGTEKLSLRDHRMQIIIRDAFRYREAQAKAKAPAPKPVPQVQRPGVSRPRGAGDAERVEALSTKLEKTGSIKDAAALLKARRAG